MAGHVSNADEVLWASVDSLYDNATAMMAYNAATTENARAFLTYDIALSLEVDVAVRWDILQSLVLEKISLQASLSKTSDRDAVLAIQLRAEASIDDVRFIITGNLPRLEAGQDCDFVFSLQVAGFLDTSAPLRFVEEILGSTSGVGGVRSSLDSALAEQMDADSSGNGGHNSLATASIHFRRIGNGQNSGTVLVRQMEIALQSRFDYSIIPGHLDIEGAAMSLKWLRKEDPSSSWEIALSLEGSMLLDDMARIVVLGQLRVGASSQMSIKLVARPISGLLASDVFGLVVSPQLADSALPILPPGLVYPDSPFEPFSIALTLDKQSSLWRISQASASVDMLGLQWQPISSWDVYVRSITLFLSAAQTTAMDPWTYRGEVSGLVQIAGFPISVGIQYDSKTGKTLLKADLYEWSPSLADIAADSLLSANRGLEEASSHDLIAYTDAFFAPEISPVDLSWCTDRRQHLARRFEVSLESQAVAQVFLEASYSSVSWNVFSTLVLTNMGISFLIINPRGNASLPATTIQGFAFGHFQLETVMLRMFFAGLKNSEEMLIDAQITAGYYPNGALGLHPQALIKDSRLGGIADGIPTAGWKTPDSYHGPQPQAILQRVEAHARVRLRQGTQGQQFFLETIVFRLDTETAWRICTGVAFTSVALQAVVKPATAINGNVSSFALGLSALTSGLSSDSVIYTVTLDVSLQKDASDAYFEGSVTVYRSMDVLSLADPNTVMSLDLFGSKTIEPSLGQELPAQYPVQLTHVVHSKIATCTLRAAKDSQSQWFISSLSFTLGTQDSWDIVPHKVIVTSASLSLVVGNPRGQASFSLGASFFIDIGSQARMEGLAIARDGTTDSGSFTLSFNIVETSKMLRELTGSDVSLPMGSPSPNQNLRASLTFRNKTNERDYQLKRLEVEYKNQSWAIGPLIIGRLSLVLTFDEHDTYTVSFLGEASFGGVQVQVEILQANQKLQIRILAGISSERLVSQFVSGSWRNVKDTPQLPSESKLDSYQTSQVSADATIEFEKQADKWQATQLDFLVRSTETWHLVQDVLWLDELRVGISITELGGSSAKVKAILLANIGFKQRPTTSGTTGDGSLPVTVEADKRHLMGTLSLEKCSVPQILYIASGGLWNPPDMLFLDTFLPERVTLFASWVNQKHIVIEATYSDWVLPSPLEHLARMRSPHLSLSLKGSLSSLVPSGFIAGTALLLETVSVPLSFDLPTGPFRIFGIDVKKAYELAKKLYEALKYVAKAAEIVEEVCAVISALAAYSEVAGTAVAVAAALKAAGIAEDIVDDAIARHYGQERPEDTSPESSRDTKGPEVSSKPFLVVGGTAVCSGPPGENTVLRVYAKNAYGRSMPLTLADLKLTLTLTVGMNINFPSIAWTQIPGGYETQLVRPSSSYELKLEYPEIMQKYAVTTDVRPSRFSAENSSLVCPASVDAGAPFEAIIFPRDEARHARYGVHDASEFHVVTESPSLEIGTIITRNDSIIIPLRALFAGQFRFQVRVNAIESVFPLQPFVISASGSSLDPSQCIISGNGLVSGDQSEQVQVFVSLRDHMNVSFNMPLDTQDLLVASVSPIEGHKQNCQISYEIGQALFSYTRPRIPETRPTRQAIMYSLEVKYADSHLAGSPFYLESRNTTQLSARNCTLDWRSSTGGPPQATVDIIVTINLYDESGSRYYGQLPNGAATFVITWQTNQKPVYSTPFRDNGDGTLTATWNFGRIGPPVFFVKRWDNSESIKRGGFSFNLEPPPRREALTIYGVINPEAAKSGRRSFQLMALDTEERTVSTYASLFDIRAFSNTMTPVDVFSTSQGFDVDIPNPTGSTCILVRPKSTEAGNPYLPSSLHEPLIIDNSGTSTLKEDQTVCCWSKVQGMGISSLLVTTRDSGRLSWPSGGAKVQLQAPNSAVILWQETRDLHNRSYRVRYKVPVTSGFDFLVLVNNVVVPPSPFRFVRDVNEFYNATVTGDGLSTCTAGHEASFLVRCYDLTGKVDILCVPEGPKVFLYHPSYSYMVPTRIETVTEQGDKCFKVTYTPPYRHLDTLQLLCEVWVNGTPATKQPATISIRYEDPEPILATEHEMIQSDGSVELVMDGDDLRIFSNSTRTTDLSNCVIKFSTPLDISSMPPKAIEYTLSLQSTGSGRLVLRFFGGWSLRLRAQGSELGENIWLDPLGS
ncbi:hypothetical protein HJFPF1_09765 [Paramyrothecium foliicola]|nr:hypothetical protein HJFPF1_09765 [Paramyrothecium foliicola]